MRPAWVSVCEYDDLEPEIGVAALVKGKQVALFKLPDGTLRAVGNRDPFSGTQSVARGVVGVEADGIAFVVTLHARQRFDLDTGLCLSDRTVGLPTYPVRVVNGKVEVCVPVRT